MLYPEDSIAQHPFPSSLCSLFTSSSAMFPQALAWSVAGWGAVDKDVLFKAESLVPSQHFSYLFVSALMALTRKKRSFSGQSWVKRRSMYIKNKYLQVNFAA